MPVVSDPRTKQRGALNVLDTFMQYAAHLLEEFVSSPNISGIPIMRPTDVHQLPILQEPRR